MKMEVVFMILTSFVLINSIAMMYQELVFNPKKLYINSENKTEESKKKGKWRSLSISQITLPSEK